MRHEAFSGEAIDEAADQLRDILPAIILMHGGVYQENLFKLIESLEAANGEDKLDRKEQQLLQRLKYHE